MTPIFYLFINSGKTSDLKLDESVLSWVFEDEYKNLKLATGRLSDAAAASINHQVIVVLPGEDVLYLTAEIPGKNTQRILQAVPYALEDSLIDDVDNLHFAIKKQNEKSEDNYYQVSVVNKQKLEAIITQLEKHGVYADVISADYFLLKNENTLFSENERILFNGNASKFSLDIKNINDFAPYFSTSKPEALIQCDKGTAENTRSDGAVKNFGLDEETLNIVFCENHPLLCLVENSSSDKAINLLQGQYKKRKNWSKTGKRWVPVAALFLLWLSLQGGFFIVDYMSLSSQSKALTENINLVYKKTFPESRRIIDAKAQMKQKLSSLRKRKGQSGRGFTEMFSASADVFSKIKELKIKSLRYYDGNINVELMLPDLQILDKLKSQLVEKKGYQVEIKNVSSGKQSVTAVLQIIGASS